MPNGKADLEALLPHAGAMCLLDAVVSWDASGILCRTWSHRRTDNPLRCQQGLSALQGVEYGGQAMALHGALLAGSDGDLKVRGYLVAVRDLVLNVDWLDPLEGHMDVTAELEIDTGRYVVHRFKIESEGDPLVSGRMTVVRPRG